MEDGAESKNVGFVPEIEITTTTTPPPLRSFWLQRVSE